MVETIFKNNCCPLNTALLIPFTSELVNYSNSTGCWKTQSRAIFWRFWCKNDAESNFLGSSKDSVRLEQFTNSVATFYKRLATNVFKGFKCFSKIFRLNWTVGRHKFVYFIRLKYFGFIDVNLCSVTFN